MPTVNKLDDRTIIDQVIAARRESYESRRVKDSWARKAWQWYNNTHDYSNKEDWQSKVYIPKFAMAIDQAENFLKDGLKKSTRVFGIEVLNDDPVDKLLAAFFGAVIHEIIRKMGLLKKLPGDLKVALISNSATNKVGYEEFERTELAPVLRQGEEDIIDPDSGEIIGKQPFAKYEEQEISRLIQRPTARLVDHYRFFPDPRGMDLYKIEEIDQDLWWVIDRFSGLTPTKVLNEMAMDMRKGEAPIDEEQVRIDRRDRQEIIDTTNAFRSIVKLTDYYGPLFTRDGKLVAERVRVVLANDKHILIRGEPWPHWDGEDPFVTYNAITVPFSVWGKVLVQHSDSLQMYINEFASLLLDKAKLSALTPMAVDTTLLEDVEDIMTGLFPGKLFKFRGPSGLQELQFSGMDQGHSLMQGFLDQEHQNSHGVTEFLQGLPTSRGRATAFEVEQKTSQGMQFFGGIVDNATDGVERLLEKIYYRVMQYMDDWTDPSIMKIAQRFGLAEAMKNMNPVVRYNLMKRPFRFHAAGLNAAIRRAEMLKNMVDLVTLLGNLGEGALAAVDLNKVLQKIFDVFDLEELMNIPAANPSVIVPSAVDDGRTFPTPGLENGQLSPQLQQGVQATAEGRRR